MMGGRGGTSRGRRNSATLGLTSLILRGFPAWTSLPSNGSPSLSLLLFSSGFALILSFPSGTRARRAHVQDDYCTPGTGVARCNRVCNFHTPAGRNLSAAAGSTADARAKPEDRGCIPSRTCISLSFSLASSRRWTDGGELVGDVSPRGAKSVAMPREIIIP